MSDEKPKKPNPKAKAFGLILTLGGAPASWHELPGRVYGMFHPDRAAPVGGPGEPTFEQAEELDADPGCPLALVELDPDDVPGLRAAAAAARRAQLRGATNEGQE